MILFTIEERRGGEDYKEGNGGCTRKRKFY